MLYRRPDDPEHQTDTGTHHDPIDPDHMQVAANFIFNLVNHLARIPFVNALADKTNDFFTVLVTQVNRDSAETFIQQLTYRGIRDDIFTDLLNSNSEIFRNTGIRFLQILFNGIT